MTPAVEQDLAIGLDRLAEQVLANLAPLYFEVARTAADVDAAFRLRYDCVVEMSWARPEDYPDGRERDEYDDGATQLVCRDGTEIVGTLRLVRPEPDRPLPVERDFGIRIDPPGEAADSGRLVVAPSHRGLEGHPVLSGLYSRCWLEARRLGYSRIVAAASPTLVDLYKSLGLRIRFLGPPKMSWGQKRRPYEISGREDTFAAVAGR